MRPFLSLLLLAFCLHLMPSALAQSKTAKIEVAVVPGALRFATTRFDVAAGSSVALTVKNTCVMPHNLVLVKPGSTDDVVLQAMALGADGFAKDYVPDSPHILAATKIIAPGDSETLSLKAPETPGDYPYVCTFPGHGTVMRGVMRVRAAGQKLEKAVTEKLDSAKINDALKESGVTSAPMGSRERPYVLRSFVPNPGLGEEVLAHHGRGQPAKAYDPNAGGDVKGKEDVRVEAGLPTGIAVSFGPDFAYVWDATECRLLYAWTGGFLDLTAYWGAGTGGGRRGKNYVPEIVGQLVYKAKGPSPLKLGDGKQPPRFLGYRMVGGSPEFSYRIGSVTVHEHIVPANPGTFMVHYRLENAPADAALAFDPEIRKQIACDQGTWKGDTLTLSKTAPASGHGGHGAHGKKEGTPVMLLVTFAPGEKFRASPAKSAKNSGGGEP